MGDTSNSTSRVESNRVNVYQRLFEAQKHVVVPRQESRFKGGSRSAEQILEKAKVACRDNGLLLVTTEEVEHIADRSRIKATATVYDTEDPSQFISASASAWEGDISAGLDASQVSGKTGSYAKKYALQHLFAIDDTKDADFDDKPKDDSPAPQTAPAERPKASAHKPASDKQIGLIKSLATKAGKDDEWLATVLMKVNTSADASAVIEKLQADQ